MSMYNDASLALIPSAVGDGVVYNARPVEVLGAEMVTNGDFSNGLTNWYVDDGTSWTNVNNTAFCDGNNGLIAQNHTLTQNKVYKVTFDSVATNSSGKELGVRIANGTYSWNLYPTGTHTIYLTAGSSGTQGVLFYATNGWTGSIDNVSVKEVLTSAQDFDFTRASEATRVLSGGRIEKVRTNSILQSNDFDTTWGPYDITVTSGQADKDGGTDAWLLTKSAASARLYQSGLSRTGIVSFSLYVKANASDYILVMLRQSGSDPYAYFDVSTGAMGTTYLVADTSITSVGDGWYRCTISADMTGGLSELRIFPAQANGDVSATSGSVYIQNAQLEDGTVATEYIETTTTSVSVGSVNDMPRLDWSGGCPSLLLEPQRTNLVTQSEYFGASTWTERSLSVTDNYATSPDGSVNASRILASGSDAALYQSISVTNGTTYTMSVWLKVASGTLDTTISFSSTGFPDGEGDGGKYKDITVTDTWQRFSLTSTADQTISTITAPIGGFGGFNSGDDVLMWGAQCEVGSYATSYIPTYGTAATRVTDVCHKDGIGSVFGTNVGTFFIDAIIENAAGENEYYFEVSDNAGGNRIAIYGRISDGTFRFYDGSVDYAVSGIVSGTRNKVAVMWNGTTVKVYIDGVERINQAIAVHNPTSINIASRYSESDTPKVKANQVLVFNTALSDTELEKLTTL